MSEINILPHPEKDLDRANPTASTATVEPCHGKRKATKQSKEQLLRRRANAGGEFVQWVKILFVLGYSLPVCSRLSFYNVGQP
jgi:hypothetical protein